MAAILDLAIMIPSAQCITHDPSMRNRTKDLLITRMIFEIYINARYNVVIFCYDNIGQIDPNDG